MYSDDRFEFGQYEGLLLSEVFFGGDKIDSELIKFILNTRSAQILRANSKLSKCINIEVSSTLIKIHSKIKMEELAVKQVAQIVVSKLLEFNDYDLHRYNLHYFNSGEFERKIITGNREYLKHCYRENWDMTTAFCLSPLIISGHPKYVEWLIKNLDTFYLNLDEIEDIFSKEDVIIFDKFNYHFVTNYIAEFEPVFQKRNWNFSEHILEINREKFFKNASKDEIYSLRGYENAGSWDEEAKNERRQLERNNFDELTGGQYGDFDDLGEWRE